MQKSRRFFAIVLIPVGLIIIWMFVLPTLGRTVIEIKGLEFTPNNIKISEGDRAVWINRDLEIHDVVAVDPELREALAPFSFLIEGDTLTHIFTEPGEYEYFCSIHHNMKGKITVA